MKIRRITSAVTSAGAVVATAVLATPPSSAAVDGQDVSAAAPSRAIGSSGTQGVSAPDSRRAVATRQLLNYFSGLCAGVGSQTGNGAPVIQWTCNNSLDELWEFVPTTDNNGYRAYFLKNRYSGKCMGVGSSLANGARVIQYTCNGAVDEKWWWDRGDLTYRNVYSGKCLEVPSTTTAGARAIQWTCNGGRHQQWL
ncbi:RICIN domain-containing protein [Streptomyces sp. NPDC051018]|uniref:RICIN domain-containing protein n=1 Tax=Streptomyces sp. NPDC051018 TaxID=3365639 RepID=UPI0037A86F1C